MFGSVPKFSTNLKVDKGVLGCAVMTAEIGIVTSGIAHDTVVGGNKTA